MTQLIDKAAVVAEIERQKKDYSYGSSAESKYRVEAYKEILSFLDTLEVKEVDLEKKIEKCLKRHCMLAIGKKDFTDIAKHFFELGLNAQRA